MSDISKADTARFISFLRQQGACISARRYARGQIQRFGLKEALERERQLDLYGGGNSHWSRLLSDLAIKRPSHRDLRDAMMASGMSIPEVDARVNIIYFHLPSAFAVEIAIRTQLHQMRLDEIVARRMRTRSLKLAAARGKRRRTRR